MPWLKSSSDKPGREPMSSRADPSQPASSVQIKAAVPSNPLRSALRPSADKQM